MCGIAGTISVKNLRYSDLLTLSEGIKHRGPDSDGIYLSSADYSIKTTATDLLDSNFNDDTVSLIHRRFSIIDLSSRSAQPFYSEDGNIILAFNGEIYNYLEIRKDLENKYKETFSTESDTEVVLKAYIHYGVDCFAKFNGFWAIAITDKRKQSVILSRDYYGKKPLYLSRLRTGLVFSSELKPLVSLCQGIGIQKQSAFDYLVFDQRDSYKASMFDGIDEVGAGTYQIYTNKGEKIEERSFWEIPSLSNDKISYNEASEEYNRLFERAVDLRLRADVPIDINLSGGLDSAAIAVAVAKSGATNVGCHTFRFDGDGIDESPQARIIAESLGFKLDIISLSQNDLWDKINEYIYISEEPVHSPTCFVQQAAWDLIGKEGYKVVLHGSGNDEFLCGYQYFEQIKSLALLRNRKYLEYFKTSKYGAKTNLGRIFKWQVLGKNITNVEHLSSLYNTDFISDDFSKVNRARYEARLKELAQVNLDCDTRRKADIDHLRFPYWNKLMDKNSMSVPIEVRMPYLDKDLSNFVLTLPEHHLFGNGLTKRLLRDYIGKNLPTSITQNHIKVGFQTPDAIWMERSRKKVLEELLAAKVHDYLDIDYITQNYHKLPARLLWRAYNFALWKTKFIGVN
jgi:asparagine synthase (glutamine-hydrolysing)